MKQNRFFAFLLFLVLISFVNVSTHAQVRVPEHLQRDRTLRRVLPAKISPAMFGAAAAPAETVDLEFFADVSMRVRWTSVERRANLQEWSGRVEGTRFGTATFVLAGNTLTGSATRGDGKVYQVRTAEDGTRWSLEIDQTLIPNEANPLPMSLGPPSPLPGAASDEIAFDDDGSTIDVLVVYTQSARQAAGGTTSIQSLIQLGIVETNQGYINSGVIHRVRLVGSQEVDYTESSSLSTDLGRLRTTGDGIMDDVHVVRNAAGADLVSLWTHRTSPGSCGIGYLLTQLSSSPSALSAFGFNVVEQQCATGVYTFGHELGHNMGAHHAKDDVDSDGVPQGAYPYSNGYKQLTPPNKFRTIMAYDTNCSCPRLNNWSNPNVSYLGLPTGINQSSPQSAVNYLTLNNTRTIVANYRASTFAPPGGIDSNPPYLTITSHTGNQSVTSSSITLAGLATDLGRGDNGISSVTVNGVRASGDTAVGNGTANWSRAITLNIGPNLITVVARDNTSAQNATTVTITLTLTTQTSPTSNTYHVFPQFADGIAADGSFYRTTLMVSNPSASSTVTCTFQLYGLTVNGTGTYTFTFSGSGWTIQPIFSSQSLRSGYAAMNCSQQVEAQLLYSLYAANGVKVSEATVFSSPSANWLQVSGDNRQGSRIAVAIANDSDSTRTYTITAYNNMGASVGTANRTLAARANLAAFVDEVVPLPANYYGLIYVTGTGGTSGSVIGLRFTGAAFTTIPAVVRSSVAPTASTYHVFPQFADGRLSDGSYYRTTLMIANPSSSGGVCTFRLYGVVLNNNVNAFTFNNFGAGSWAISPISSDPMLNFDSGYATLNCEAPVEAQLLYSFYSSSGIKLSEATVFSSPSAGWVQVLADHRGSSQLGVAIANDSDQSASYTITAFDENGASVGTATQQLSARNNVARFLNELIPNLPSNYFGRVYVTGTGAASSSIIGLRFTGPAFTTIPETIR